VPLRVNLLYVNQDGKSGVILSVVSIDIFMLMKIKLLLLIPFNNMA